MQKNRRERNFLVKHVPKCEQNLVQKLVKARIKIGPLKEAMKELDNLAKILPCTYCMHDSLTQVS